MDQGMSRYWRRQSRSLDAQLSACELPASKNHFFAETFDPYKQLPIDSEDRTLWWKLFDLRTEDFYDWQVRQVDEFTSSFCGLVKTSPYFSRISESHKESILKFLDAPVEVFESIAEEFEARMNGRVQHKRLLLNVNGYELGIFRYGRTVYAVENLCPHQGGPLGLGDIEEVEGRLCVVCPWHHWRFELSTGKSWQPYRSNKPPANVFLVKTVEGKLYVGFEQYNPKLFVEDDY